MDRGRLIAISGCDGSGKSTLVRALIIALEERGVPVLGVSPLKPDTGGTARWARTIPVPGPLKEAWIAQYFALVLADNAQRTIRPALLAGTWVVADRWALDHLANQSALGVPPEVIGPWLGALPTPDTHLLIDVPVRVALDRIRSRSQDPGFGDGERFLARASEGMRTAGVATILDGTRTPGELLEAALAAVPDPTRTSGVTR